MTEPTYNYVKGKGWVVGPAANQMVFGDYLVTLEERDPEPGERWTADSGRLGIEEYIKLLHRAYRHSYNSIVRGGQSHTNYAYHSCEWPVYVIKLEKIK